MFIHYVSVVDGDKPAPATRAERRADAGVEANARLTAVNAVVLLVLFAVEGFTILGVGRMLTLHVFAGMVLVPPAVVETASTCWRFVRYYGGAPAYRRKGPPPMLLRMLGPVVILLTLVLLVSGIGILLVPSQTPLLLKVHKASFILWFGAMAIHVLGHIAEVARFAPRDWARRGRRDVRAPACGNGWSRSAWSPGLSSASCWSAASCHGWRSGRPHAALRH